MSLLLLTSSCSQEPVKPNGNVMPMPIYLVLLDKQGNELLTSEDTPLVVSSFNSQGQRFYVSSLNEYPDGKTKLITAIVPSLIFPYHFVYHSITMPLASSNGSKDWYLELNGKTDTLRYDVQHTRPQALNNQYDVMPVSFNGQSVAVSGGSPDNPYYVLRRRQ
ncbi:hypothetical protein HBN54_004682 [Hymenobacter sp. 1B]|uniref:Uncharacterized protein n=1 Tax=Hymenobacter artigasi TaxID=2719616 RepID=A0ABX1HP77_9BACT|nr:hypothetical protein [Hymenobacter artigasi]